MDDLKVTVTGMTCGGCENAVRRALEALDGVTDVTASHAANTVTLRYDASRVTPDAIAGRIDALGYTAARPPAGGNEVSAG